MDAPAQPELIIHHVPSIMFHDELRPSRIKVGIRRQGCHSLYEAIISCGWVGVCCGTSVVESCEDTRRTAFLNEIANDLVIEVLDRRPFDLFPNVLLLLGLQREFDEDLLKLLVDIVDTKLLEGVVPEDLEAEDVLLKS